MVLADPPAGQPSAASLATTKSVRLVLCLSSYDERDRFYSRMLDKG